MNQHTGPELYPGLFAIWGREACLDPERPPTSDTKFDLECPSCVIALRAAISVVPPPGEFRGWWVERDATKAMALTKGVVL